MSTWLPPTQPSAQQRSRRHSASPAQQPSAQHKPSPAAVGTAAERSPAQPRPAAQPRARTLRRLAKSSFLSTCNHHGHSGAHMHARICASAVQESLIEGEQTLVCCQSLQHSAISKEIHKRFIVVQSALWHDESQYPDDASQHPDDGLLTGSSCKSPRRARRRGDRDDKPPECTLADHRTGSRQNVFTTT